MAQQSRVLQSMFSELIEWVKNRLTKKFTVPVHLAGGILLAFVYLHYPNFAILLFILFAVFELWQSVAHFIFTMNLTLHGIPLTDVNMSYASRKDDTGYLDFLDVLVGAFFGGFVIWLKAII